MTRAEELNQLYEALVSLSHISKDTRKLLKSVIADIADLDETVATLKSATFSDDASAFNEACKSGYELLRRVAERNAK